MTTELTKAAQQALEALDEIHAGKRHPQLALAVAHNLRRALNQRPAAQTEREADGLPLIVAGAIFDFAGFMTTRSEVIEVGSTAEAGPVADLVKEWAELRGLDLADAAVLSWQLHITRASLPTTQQATPEPGCTRSHPHENMSATCELRTEIARLRNENTRLKAATPKPFAAPGRWFPVDVLGNPMREFEPGKWEVALWPSATPEPVGEVVAWQRRDRNIVTGEWSEWHEDDDIEEELDPEWAERRPLSTRPAPGVPEGFALVPVEPTEEMTTAVEHAMWDKPSVKGADVWSAVLAAAQAKGGA